MLNPGKLKHKIAFQVQLPQRNGVGEVLEQWETVATTWAAIDPISGKEFYAAEQSQSQVSHKVRLRYRPGLSTAMRILHGKRVLEIVSIINWEERNESLLIMCKELVL